MMAEVYHFECENKNPDCKIEFDFENEAIFVWSKDICLGDEIFHDYFKNMGSTETLFSTFCASTTKTYRNTGYKASFLSAGTFTSCVISWIINWDIDYRKEVWCPYCQYNPRFLACDGTHVGVTKEHMLDLEDISKKEKNEVKKTRHRKFDRTLISGKGKNQATLRKYMLGFCNFFRNIKKNKKDGKTFKRNNSHEVAILNLFDDIRAKRVFQLVFDGALPQELNIPVTSFIHSLNRQASLINFFPTKESTWLREHFEQLRDESLPDNQRFYLMKKLAKYRPQFAILFDLAKRHNYTWVMGDFFLFLMDKKDDTHKQDFEDTVDEPTELGTYDPSKGIAYGFTPHGGQVRKLPRYAIDGTCMLKCKFMLLHYSTSLLK